MINGQSPSETSQQRPLLPSKNKQPQSTLQNSSTPASTLKEKSKPVSLTLHPEIVQFLTTEDYKGGLVINIFEKNADLIKQLSGHKYKVSSIKMTIEQLD